jgi:hypothetical protein
MNEILTYTHTIESGGKETAKDKEPSVGTVGTDVSSPTRKVGTPRHSTYLSIMLCRPKARVDDVRNSRLLTS